MLRRRKEAGWLWGILWGQAIAVNGRRYCISAVMVVLHRVAVRRAGAHCTDRGVTAERQRQRVVRTSGLRWVSLVPLLVVWCV